MQGPKWPFLLILFICGPYVVILNYLGRVLYLGRAPCTKETLPDFREWCRVTRHPRVFRGLTGCQLTPRVLGRHNGSLRYRGRVVVPRLADLREEILKEFHCSRFTVHPGGIKMYHRRQYYRRRIKKHVVDFVRRCLTCQQVKAEHQKPVGLLQPLEVAE